MQTDATMSVSEIPVCELRTANHLLNDFGKLSAFYHEEGYLFFRNALDKHAVLRAKQEFVCVLRQQEHQQISGSVVCRQPWKWLEVRSECCEWMSCLLKVIYFERTLEL